MSCIPRRRLVALASALIGLSVGSAFADTPFRFEDRRSLADMQEAVRTRFPVGSPRALLRSAFVQQGGATLKIHPTQAGVEKYIYDINLCRYYVFRWNISADYDAEGKARQIYVNGEPALPDGAPPRAVSKPSSPSHKASIIRVTRERPEASKGEHTLVSMVVDWDSNPKTIDDQELLGGGPTRADLNADSTLHVYHVEPWRSIFDEDATRAVVPYKGDCSQADAAAKNAGPQSGLGASSMVVDAMMQAGERASAK